MAKNPDPIKPTEESKRDDLRGTSAFLLRNNTEMLTKDSTLSSYRSVIITDDKHVAVPSGTMFQVFPSQSGEPVAAQLGKHGRCEDTFSGTIKELRVGKDGPQDKMNFYILSSSPLQHWKWDVKSDQAKCFLNPGGVEMDKSSHRISPSCIFGWNPPRNGHIVDNKSISQPPGGFLTGFGVAEKCYMILDTKSFNVIMKIIENEPEPKEEVIVYRLSSGRATTFYYRCKDHCYVIAPEPEDPKRIGAVNEAPQSGYTWTLETY